MHQVEYSQSRPAGGASNQSDDTRRTALLRLAEQLSEWERHELADALRRSPERKPEFTTGSGLPLKRVYTPLDVADIPPEDIGLPGQYPFTRGPYPTMHRGRLWTMRMFAGYGTPEDTNARFKFLIAQGQTGLSTAFDMPTLMGYDSDHPLAAGEVGREGVAIDTLDDMQALFDGIDLTQISVSMTINPTAWVLLAMYVALARERGHDLNALSGTLQADILKEYQAQKEWIFPIRPSVRLVRDTIMWTAQHMQRFNPISLSGYHISEAGANAVQEASFVLANAFEYVQQVVDAGMDVDAFAPRLSFFWTSQADFFEEIAKFRAARRVYAKVMKERFGARNPDSQRLRFHAQTAAVTLTRAQPYNNLTRTALQALAAVLGGCQSLHTNGFDESYALPSEFAATLALRTQQIIAEETNVASVADPLGGSYFVESLTSDMERRIFDTLIEIERQGGVIVATEAGWFQRQIADSAYDSLRRKERGDRVVVGVNKHADSANPDIPLHPHDEAAERRQIERLLAVKASRDNARVQSLLDRLVLQASTPANLVPVTIELVQARATVGEIADALKRVWGTYREPGAS